MTPLEPIPHPFNPASASPMFRTRLAAARYVAAICRFSNLRLSGICLKGIRGPFVVSRPFFDHDLYVDLGRGNPQCMLYLQGERFIEERRMIQSLVRPGLAAIDIGANIGYYALMLASYVGSDGSVHCLEPDPDNLVELRRNVNLNRLSNIRVIAAAAARSAGTAGLARGLNAHVVDPDGSETLVRTVAIDDLQVEAAGFMKIDVEGYEFPVLLGAQGLIEKQHPNLFVEMHPQLQRNHHETTEALRFISERYRDVVCWSKRRFSPGNRFLAAYGALSPFERTAAAESLRDSSEVFWVTATNHDPGQSAHSAN